MGEQQLLSQLWRWLWWKETVPHKGHSLTWTYRGPSAAPASIPAARELPRPARALWLWGEQSCTQGTATGLQLWQSQRGHLGT